MFRSWVSVQTWDFFFENIIICSFEMKWWVNSKLEWRENKLKAELSHGLIPRIYVEYYKGDSLLCWRQHLHNISLQSSHLALKSNLKLCKPVALITSQCKRRYCEIRYNIHSAYCSIDSLSHSFYLLENLCVLILPPFTFQNQYWFHSSKSFPNSQINIHICMQ